MSAFALAVKRGDVDEVERLLSLDPMVVDVRSGLFQMTPLMLAAQMDHLEVVTLLLERGAGVDLQDGQGYTAMYWAARRGHEEVLAALADHGASPSTKTYGGWTALMAAADKDRIRVVDMLIQRGAEAVIDERNKGGRTALWLACNNGRPEVVRTLLVAGADATIPCKAGVTPKEVAEMHDHQAILAMLEWFEDEMERNYVLCKARHVVDDVEAIIKAPAKVKARTPEEMQQAREEAAPLYLRRRVELSSYGGGTVILPVVEVPLPRQEAELTRSGGEEHGGMRSCVLEYTIKRLSRDLYTELIEMMSPLTERRGRG